MKPVFVKLSIFVRFLGDTASRTAGVYSAPLNYRSRLGPAAVPIGQNRPSVQHARNDAYAKI